MLGLWAFSCLLSWWVDSGHRSLQAQEPAGFEWTFPAMGTTVHFLAYGRDSEAVERAFREARAEIDRLVAVFSDYDEESEVLQLCQSSDGTKPVAVSEDLWKILVEADRWHQRSEGAFDVSIGAVTRLWRTARKKKELPDENALRLALANSGWKHVHLLADQRAVLIAKPGIRLDLGAIAKGYIVDRAFEQLVRAGFESSMVNAGGDLRCGDPPPGRSGWRVEVAGVSEKGPPLRHLLISRAAIATSGDLWQYVMVDGNRRSHILDPKTGLGVEGPMSGSVIAPTATDADAGATTLCVLGWTKGIHLFEDLNGMDALIARRDPNSGQIEYTETSDFARQVFSPESPRPHPPGPSP
jgi:thiamine biosynthesis lipoprotein